MSVTDRIQLTSDQLIQVHMPGWRGNPASRNVTTAGIDPSWRPRAFSHSALLYVRSRLPST